jgi:NTP pyrophosphatase (non-canonical NTP hydrolase)
MGGQKIWTADVFGATVETEDPERWAELADLHAEVDVDAAEPTLFVARLVDPTDIEWEIDRRKAAECMTRKTETYVRFSDGGEEGAERCKLVKVGLTVHYLTRCMTIDLGSVRTFASRETPGKQALKVLEEAAELLEAVRHGTTSDVDMEFGDVLTAVANLAACLQLDDRDVARIVKDTQARNQERGRYGRAE